MLLFSSKPNMTHDNYAISIFIGCCCIIYQKAQVMLIPFKFCKSNQTKLFTFHFSVVGFVDLQCLTHLPKTCECVGFFPPYDCVSLIKSVTQGDIKNPWQSLSILISQWASFRRDVSPQLELSSSLCPRHRLKHIYCDVCSQCPEGILIYFTYTGTMLGVIFKNPIST